MTIASYQKQVSNVSKWYRRRQTTKSLLEAGKEGKCDRKTYIALCMKESTLSLLPTNSIRASSTPGSCLCRCAGGHWWWTDSWKGCWSRCWYWRHVRTLVRKSRRPSFPRDRRCRSISRDGHAHRLQHFVLGHFSRRRRRVARSLPRHSC